LQFSQISKGGGTVKVKLKLKKGQENDPKTIKEMLTRMGRSSLGNPTNFAELGIEPIQADYIVPGEDPPMRKIYSTEENVLVSIKDAKQDQL